MRRCGKPHFIILSQLGSLLERDISHGVYRTDLLYIKPVSNLLCGKQRHAVLNSHLLQLRQCHSNQILLSHFYISLLSCKDKEIISIFAEYDTDC